MLLALHSCTLGMHAGFCVELPWFTEYHDVTAEILRSLLEKRWERGTLQCAVKAGSLWLSSIIGCLSGGPIHQPERQTAQTVFAARSCWLDQTGFPTN